MDFLGALGKLLGGNQQQKKKPVQQPQRPDITYDPQNRGLPYTAISPQDARLGNEYTANPTAQKFIGVDPARFGYPADNTRLQVRNSPLPTAPRASFSGVQAATNPYGDYEDSNIQGPQNPGFIPLQNSGFGGRGYTANLQPTVNDLDSLRKRLRF